MNATFVLESHGLSLVNNDLCQKSGEITRSSHRFVTFYHFKLLKHRDFYYFKCFN
jgi:hypothetical protein